MVKQGVPRHLGKIFYLNSELGVPYDIIFHLTPGPDYFLNPKATHTCGPLPKTDISYLSEMIAKRTLYIYILCEPPDFFFIIKDSMLL